MGWGGACGDLPDPAKRQCGYLKASRCSGRCSQRGLRRGGRSGPRDAAEDRRRPAGVARAAAPARRLQWTGTPRDRYVIAASLRVLAAGRGDLDAAVVHHLEALEWARSAHLRSAVVTALFDLGRIERRRGDREGARAHFAECRRLAAALGRYPMLARVHNELGELHRGIGALESATHHYERFAPAPGGRTRAEAGGAQPRTYARRVRSW